MCVGLCVCVPHVYVPQMYRYIWRPEEGLGAEVTSSVDCLIGMLGN